jgi:hypothetical protein
MAGVESTALLNKYRFIRILLDISGDNPQNTVQHITCTSLHNNYILVALHSKQVFECIWQT